MATYPTLPFHVDSRRVPRDGKVEDLADSGKAYITSSYSDDKFDFELKHEALSTTDMSTLQSFYNTNRNLTIDLVWAEDGLTYTGLKFGRNGFRTEPNKQAPTRRDVYVRLIGS